MEWLCKPHRVRRSEFVLATDPKSGIAARRYGTCGPTATASALTQSLDTSVSIQAVYTWMRNHGDCDVSGASSVSENGLAATGLGGTVVAIRYYGEPWDGWHSWFTSHLKLGRPITIEVAVGQAFHDLIHGDGENASNLQYHFVTLFGYHDGGYSALAGKSLEEGFWVADGCNFYLHNSTSGGFDAPDVLQFYSATTLGNARPCGAVALKSRGVDVTPAPVPVPPPPPPIDPPLEIADCPLLAEPTSGTWGVRDAAWNVTYGTPVITGSILDFYRASQGYRDAGLPVSSEVPVPGTADARIRAQFFERLVYVFDVTHELDNPPGAGAVYTAHRELFTALDPLAPPPAPVPAPPPAPPPPPPPDLTAEIAALRAALAALLTKAGTP